MSKLPKLLLEIDWSCKLWNSYESIKEEKLESLFAVSIVRHQHLAKVPKKPQEGKK
jgi:hypothetical protein